MSPATAFDPLAPFERRLAALPRLGVGISTELGAGVEGLDLARLAAEHGDLARFLEVGADLDRGIDADARAWAAAGRPTTYHFLDVNLEEPEDLDEAWCAATAEAARSIGAAWLCGDAGLWHVGPRDRGHGTLLPPILCATSARALAESVRRLRESARLEVLPENPPACVYLGDLHLLDYFARVADLADCGLLLDVAHLAIYQRATGRSPRDGLDGFPFERVVEVHVAGGTPFEAGGRTFVDDDHGTAILDDTWELAEEVAARAPNLRAIVFECERNALEDVLPGFRRLAALDARPRPAAATPERRGAAQGDGSPRAAGAPAWEGRSRELQRTLFRMQLDPGFARDLRARAPAALASTGLAPAELAPLLSADPCAVAADPERRRVRQLCGNVALELARTVDRAALAAGRDDLLARFVASPELHGALRSDEPLPLALAAYLERELCDARDPVLRAFLALEAALARARRAAPASRRPGPGEVALGAAASLLELPEGTLAAAEAADRGEEPPPPRGDGRETLLVLQAPGRWPGAVREVTVEGLSPALAGLLRAAAQRPLDAARRGALARELGAAPDELEELCAELAGEGVLERG